MGAVQETAPDRFQVKQGIRERRVLLDRDVKELHPLNELATSTPEDEVAARYRNRAGGNLLFRPVGLLFIVGAIRRLVGAGFKQDQVIMTIGNRDLDLNAHPWERLIWDPVNRRMLVSGENRVVAEHILVYGLTRDENLIGQSEKSLRKEWAGLVGQKSSRALSYPIGQD